MYSVNMVNLQLDYWITWSHGYNSHGNSIENREWTQHDTRDWYQSDPITCHIPKIKKNTSGLGRTGSWLHHLTCSGSTGCQTWGYLSNLSQWGMLGGGRNFDLRSMGPVSKMGKFSGKIHMIHFANLGHRRFFHGRWRHQEHHQRLGAWWRLCLEVNSPRKNAHGAQGPPYLKRHEPDTSVVQSGES